MLDRAHRITTGDEFASTLRRGRRAGSRTLVVHIAGGDATRPPRAGFVVGKAVGRAVTRNQVKRRLRELVRARLDTLPPGAMLVVRALPPAADSTFDGLAADLDRALARVRSRP